MIWKKFIYVWFMNHTSSSTPLVWLLYQVSIEFMLHFYSIVTITLHHAVELLYHRWFWIFCYAVAPDNALECVEVTKKFGEFVIMRLRQKYSKVIIRLIHIFEEKEVNIKELITMLCFDDVEKKSIFSTDAAFSTITTEI